MPTVRSPASHLVELLPGEGALDSPRAHRPLFLDGVLQDRLQRQQHPQHVLGEQHVHIESCKNTERGVFYKHQIWLQIDLLINPFRLRKLFCWLLAEFATGLHEMKIHNICLQYFHIYNWIVLATHAGPLQSFNHLLKIYCQAHILLCLHLINNPDKLGNIAVIIADESPSIINVILCSLLVNYGSV